MVGNGFGGGEIFPFDEFTPEAVFFVAGFEIVV